MKPGRELDALVAEKVMGFVKTGKPDPAWTDTEGNPIYHDVTSAPAAFKIPHYSTSIADAWEVVGKLDGQWTLKGHEGLGWEARFYTSTGGIDAVIVDVSAMGDTAPMAICLAALKAVGHDGTRDL